MWLRLYGELYHKGKLKGYRFKNTMNWYMDVPLEWFNELAVAKEGKFIWKHILHDTTIKDPASYFYDIYGNSNTGYDDEYLSLQLQSGGLKHIDLEDYQGILYDREEFAIIRGNSNKSVLHKRIGQYELSIISNHTEQDIKDLQRCFKYIEKLKVIKGYAFHGWNVAYFDYEEPSLDLSTTMTPRVLDQDGLNDLNAYLEGIFLEKFNLRFHLKYSHTKNGVTHITGELRLNK